MAEKADVLKKVSPERIAAVRRLSKGIEAIKQSTKRIKGDVGRMREGLLTKIAESRIKRGTRPETIQSLFRRAAEAREFGLGERKKLAGELTVLKGLAGRRYANLLRAAGRNLASLKFRAVSPATFAAEAGFKFLRRRQKEQLTKEEFLKGGGI